MRFVRMLVSKTVIIYFRFMLLKLTPTYFKSPLFVKKSNNSLEIQLYILD